MELISTPSAGRCQEYFMGFMLETLPDVSYEAISDAYAKVGSSGISGSQSLASSSSLVNPHGP